MERHVTYIKQVTSPDLSFFVTADHGGLCMTKTSTATIGFIRVTSEFVEHFPRRCIDQAYVIVQAGHKDCLGILGW